MVAIVEFVGTQVKVEENALVEVPKIKGEVGDVITSDKILMVERDDKVQIGTPYITSGSVSAEIYSQDRTKKTVASIYKRRKQYKRSWGFRRDFTVLKITKVST